MEIPTSTPLPDVVTCFEIYYLMNYTKLFQLYPHSRKNMRESLKVDKDPEPTEDFRAYLFHQIPPLELTLALISNLTINQVTTSLYQSDELLEDIRIRSEGIEMDVGRSCPIKEYYKELSMCYIFACSENSSLSFSISNREKSPLSIPLFSIQFKQKLLNLIPTFYVTLIEPNTLPRGKQLVWVTFNTERRSMRFMVQFYIFHSILLPSPFGTDCRNYSLDDFSSRIDMRDQCMVNSSMEKLGVPFHTSATYSRLDTEFPFTNFYKNRHDSNYIANLVDIVDECDRKTLKPDCEIKYYITQRRVPEHIFRNESELVVEQIKQPNIRVQLHPKMLLSDCFILIGSVMGTWFGFSIYRQGGDLIRYLRGQATRYHSDGRSRSIKKSYFGEPFPQKSFSSGKKVHIFKRSPKKVHSWYTGQEEFRGPRIAVDLRNGILFS